MRLRFTLPVAGFSAPLLVLVCCSEEPRVEGKFLVGRVKEDERQLAVAFDDSAAFHKDIAENYGMRPLGGGWCEIRHDTREVLLSGRSAQFGREPDRSLVLTALLRAFPGYGGWHED